MKYLRKFKTLIEAFYGEFLKLKIRFLFHYCYNNISKENSNKKVIVSLTSYSSRVTRIVSFSIKSLMCQSYRPDKIILWLDKDEWNNNNIPSSLKKLQNYGLVIQYCEDLKSYKKIIPALKQYPDDLIITCDDDLYYKPDFIKGLVDEYNKHPYLLNVYRAFTIKTMSNGNLLPYRDWTRANEGDIGFNFFPTTGGGCIYSMQLLYRDVTSKDLFQQLAPKADDVWMYFMTILNNTQIHVCKSKNMYYEIDSLYQFFHKNSNLKSVNVNQLQNDVQINSIIKHYNIDMSKYI